MCPITTDVHVCHHHQWNMHHPKMCARIVCNVLYLNALHHPLLPALSVSWSSGSRAWLLCLAQQCSPHHVQQHYSTLLWISICIIIIFPPVLLPILLLLHSSGYSLMVLSSFYLSLCPVLSSVTYVSLCGSCFFVVQLHNPLFSSLSE